MEAIPFNAVLLKFLNILDFERIKNFYVDTNKWVDYLNFIYNIMKKIHYFMYSPSIKSRYEYLMYLLIEYICRGNYMGKYKWDLQGEI